METVLMIIGVLTLLYIVAWLILLVCLFVRDVMQMKKDVMYLKKRSSIDYNNYLDLCSRVGSLEILKGKKNK